MVKLEFGIVHEGCLVNELSRALPEVRLICPGGHILGPSSVEEILVIDQPGETDAEAVLDHLRRTPGVTEVELLERAGGRAFIRLAAGAVPAAGFVSEAVARNRCFRLGTEVQLGGVEHWQVGCARPSDVQQLLQDLEGMGEIKYHSVSEVSWQGLLEPSPG